MACENGRQPTGAGREVAVAPWREMNCSESEHWRPGLRSKQRRVKEGKPAGQRRDRTAGQPVLEGPWIWLRLPQHGRVLPTWVNPLG